MWNLARCAAGLAVCLAFPASAHALPDCTVNTPEKRVLLSGQGTLESAIVDGRGHLYFTSSANGGSLIKLNRAGATPRTLISGVAGPGGLAFHRSGDLLLGFGNTILGGGTGTIDPQAGLLRLNRKTGDGRGYAEGLAMANGVARMRDGTVFASNDIGIGIDRIAPDRTVTHSWATVVSPNGLAVSRNQRWLYANQTFVPAAIQRVRTTSGQAQEYFRPGPADIAAGLDGMVRDHGDNLFVTANLYGELWRIGSDGTACVVADGLGMASAVAIGRGTRNFRRSPAIASNRS